MLALGLLVALPFVLLMALPPVIAARIGTVFSVLAALGAGYAVWRVFELAGSAIAVAVFVGIVCQVFTGLFIMMRMHMRGEVPEDTIRLI